jgi:hypothetical protein
MSRPRNSGSRFKGLAVVTGCGDGKPVARDVQSAFDGTIASACASVGISLEQMIGMMRWAKESDPRVAQFLDAWDALDPSERQASGTADAVRQQAGLKLIELLRVVAETAYRIAMYQAQIIAALALPHVVGKTVECGLTDKGIADRRMLFQHSGFLPTPKGSQTTINVAQNTQAHARSAVVAAPLPERTTRRLTDELHERLGKPRALAARDSVPIGLPNGKDDHGE